MTSVYNSFLSEDDISDFFKSPEVQNAKNRIDSKESGSVYFTVKLPSNIKNKLNSILGLNLSDISHIPMRWIKGDTLPHIDNGIKSFENTYLAYLTDSPGELIFGDNSYPITQGTAYVFNSGLNHGTVNTGTEPRLLLGPMSEDGFAVGIVSTNLNGPGGSSVYIKEIIPGQIEYNYSGTNTWNILYFPVTVNNNDISPTDTFNIEFITDVTFTGNNQYFICNTDYIQFGSKTIATEHAQKLQLMLIIMMGLLVMALHL
jgi:hypothetical protein